MAQIPALSLLRCLPHGRVQFDTLPTLAQACADQLAGRRFMPALGHVSFPDFDTTPAVLIYAEPPVGQPRTDFVCCAILGNHDFKTFDGLLADLVLSSQKAAA